MEMLDHRPLVDLEVLALSYTVTAATSLWTWLAVVTAALGFRSICGFSVIISSSKAPSPPTPLPAVGKNQQPEPKPESLSRLAIDPKPELFQPRNGGGNDRDCHVAVCHKSAVFEAFDCYWCLQEEEQESGEGDVVNCVDEEEEEEENVEMKGMRSFTRGDLGWYRYQNPTAIDGDVVRLWKDNKWRTSPSRKLIRRWSM